MSALPPKSQRNRRTSLTALGATLIMAGCASPGVTNKPLGAPPPEVSAASSQQTASKPPQAQAVSEPSQPSTATLSANPDLNSYAWREDAKRLAQELATEWQLDPAWTWSTISKAKVKENAAKLMMPPPAGTAKNWALYRSRFVEPIRIKAGVTFWRANEALLRKAQDQYGVPASTIAGVLGVETIYGRQMGNFRVLDVLTTLSLDFPKGRSDRSAFFKAELGQFLKLSQEQGLEPESTLGSYAGAIGLPQFMPSSIRRFAVDFDGDGRIDLINSTADAIGSVAHYLAVHGWQREWPAYYGVTPPKDAASLGKLLEPDILPTFTAQDMSGLGAQLSDAATNHTGKLALVEVQNGRNNPSYVAGTANFYAITRYNQSSYYALAVIQLGDAVSQEANKQNPLP